MSTLAGLAIVAILGLATPSAFADISWTATDTTTSIGNSGSQPGNSLNTGTMQVSDFQVQIQSTRTDPNPSTLSTTTININNHGSSSESILIQVSSAGYTTGSSGAHLVMNSTIQGTSSNAQAGQTASGQTWIDTTNTLFGQPAAGTAGSLSGSANSSGATTYTFTNGGIFGPVTVTRSGNFSLTEDVTLTLGAGFQGQITISASVNSVPEPSTLAVAALGSLGFIGYGLRRRLKK
jgi:hypothetical protein